MAELRFKLNYRYGLLLIALLVFLYAIVPQFGSFRSSWQQLQHPDLDWTALGLLAIISTYLSAAANYYFLAFKPLRYGRTVLVQVAVMFINRLLPGGIGGLGANYAYLRRQNHTVVQATTVVATNNAIGLAGHTLLVIISLLVFPHYLKDFHLVNHSSIIRLVLILTGILLLAILLWGSNRVLKSIRGVLKQFGSYQKQPGRLGLALGSSILLTLGNVLGLAACCLALGVHRPFVEVLLIFSLGVGAGTAVPTPGGLGGFEAGLTAGLVASQVDGSTAIAVALLYRLISYWLPLLPGGLAFAIAQRKRVFSH